MLAAVQGRIINDLSIIWVQTSKFAGTSKRIDMVLDQLTEFKPFCADALA